MTTHLARLAAQKIAGGRRDLTPLSTIRVLTGISLGLRHRANAFCLFEG